jgi:cytoskeletal protein CcmA (bactofilin family)
MTDKKRAAGIAALVAMGLALALTTPAHAAKKDGDNGTVIISTDNNSVLIGGSVSLSAPVPENFVGVGGRVVVDQPVGHNLAGAAGSYAIRAPVGGNVGIAAGTVNIDAPIGGRLGAAGGEVRINKSGIVGGRAKIMAGNIVIDGMINGDLRAEGDTLIINGTVMGDVKAVVDTLALGPGAKINGKLTYVSSNELTKAEGATIGGAVTHVDGGTAAHSAALDDVTTAVSTGARIFGTIFSYLVLLGAGAIFIAVAPIFSVEAPDRVKASPGKSFGMGLVTLIGAPILAVLFMITLIGIPVGVMLIALYPFALLLGFVVGALFLASYVPGVFRKPPPPTVKLAIGYFAIALAVVMAVSKVPTLGGIVLCLLLVFGLGAFEVELYRRMRSGARSARTGGVEIVRP